jgi:hypothetical protein
MNSLEVSSLREGFSADEAIFIAEIASMKDCFVVPPRNDDLILESVNDRLSKDWLKYIY